MTTTNKLRLIFVGIILFCALISALFYSDVLHIGSIPTDTQSAFWQQLVAIALAIVLVPFSLKLLNFKSIRQRIAISEKSYLRWASTRLALLSVPLIINITHYYAFGLYSTAGYLAIVIAIAMLFVWPSDQRMMNERAL